MVDQIRPERANDGAHNDQRNTGPNGAGHEQRAPADLVDEEQCRQRAETVDDAVDAGGQEGGLSCVRSGHLIDKKTSPTVFPSRPSWLKIVGA